jgi:transcriptional regulator with XRE-family HTH domain
MKETNDHRVPFAELIRRRRTALRIRQQEVAEQLGVTPEAIGNWENGKRRIELDKVPRLAAILRLDEQDVCRLALSEHHPRFYAILFANERTEQQGT